jgi:hypothetical protein
VSRQPPIQSITSDKLSGYNSALYASIPTSSYQGFAVSQAFLDSPQCQNCTDTDPPDPNDVKDPNAGKTTVGTMLENLWAKSRNGSLDRLNPAECIAAYGTLIQSTRRNLLVVIADEHVDRDFEPLLPGFGILGLHNRDLLLAWSFSAPYSLSYSARGVGALDWMCLDLPRKPTVQCSDRLAELSPQNWTISSGCTQDRTGYCHPYRWPVEYCLSEPAEDRCQIHFSPLIAGVVTALNFCESSRPLTCLRRISAVTMTVRALS